MLVEGYVSATRIDSSGAGRQIIKELCNPWTPNRDGFAIGSNPVLSGD
jgi:hypothetical protein